MFEMSQTNALGQHCAKLPTQTERQLSLKKTKGGGFPGGAVGENLPANAGDMGSSPGLGGSHMPWSD